MKLLFLTTFLLSSAFLIGQENKVIVGLTGGYDYYSIDFKPTTGFNHEFEKTLGYNAGLTIQYNNNEKVFLKSGLGYAKKGYEVTYKFNFITIDPIINDPVFPKTTAVSFYYMNVPLMLGYYIKNNGKIRISIDGGINNEFLLTNTESTVFGGNTTRNTELLSQNFPSYLSSIQFNLGLEYNLGKKFVFSLHPYFKYNLNTIKNESIELNNSMYGIALEINYKL